MSRIGSVYRGPDQDGKLALQCRHTRRSLQRADSVRQPEPRVGVAYSIKPTNTVLRVSYARTLETPFNENLVLSSQGCSNEILSPLLLCSAGASGTLQPGFRNEFHAGFQQAFGESDVFRPGKQAAGPADSLEGLRFGYGALVCAGSDRL